MEPFEQPNQSHPSTYQFQAHLYLQLPVNVEVESKQKKRHQEFLPQLSFNNITFTRSSEVFSDSFGFPLRFIFQSGKGARSNLSKNRSTFICFLFLNPLPNLLPAPPALIQSHFKNSFACLRSWVRERKRRFGIKASK